MFDTLIVNARILDGSGEPSYVGEVGIADGVVTLVRRTDPRGRASADGGGAHVEQDRAAEVIDAAGQVLAPGFIDLHSHADFSIQGAPAAETQLAQGVTTALVGNCGASPFPARSLMDVRRDNAHLDAAFTGDWTGASGFLEAVEACGPGINIAAQVGLSSIRSYVLGPADRAPSTHELGRMRDEVSAAADAGVHGFSSGLIYAPGAYARPPEVTALVSRAAACGLMYSTHMRNESSALLEAVEEAIAAAEESGARLEISHLKAMGPENHGAPARALELIESARSRGVDVTADVYPYTASSTTLTSRLPGFALDGGKDRLLERLREGRARAEIAAALGARFGRDVDPAGVVIAALGEAEAGAGFGWAVGMSLVEIGDAAGCSPEEAALRVLESHGASVAVVNHAMDQADVDTVIAHRLVSVASDGWTLTRSGSGMPHPRSFGTFAKVLGEYVRDRGVLRLEDAVRKMTSLPARRLGMRDRGLVREGHAADLVVFDPDSIRENSRFDDPWHLATGVDTVLLGGRTAYSGGELSPERHGRVLRRQA